MIIGGRGSADKLLVKLNFRHYVGMTCTWSPLLHHRWPGSVSHQGQHSRTWQWTRGTSYHPPLSCSSLPTRTTNPRTPRLRKILSDLIWRRMMLWMFVFLPILMMRLACVNHGSVVVSTWTHVVSCIYWYPWLLVLDYCSNHSFHDWPMTLHGSISTIRISGHPFEKCRKQWKCRLCVTWQSRMHKGGDRQQYTITKTPTIWTF